MSDYLQQTSPVQQLPKFATSVNQALLLQLAVPKIFSSKVRLIPFSHSAKMVAIFTRHFLE